VRVLHLSAGSLSRGASRGALWLHQGLLAEGVESEFITTDPNPEGAAVRTVLPGRQGQLRLKLLKQLDRLPLRTYRFDRHATLSPGWLGLPVQAIPGYRQADVIHLHWVNDGLLDFRSLQRCSKPIVWTVRDLWPTTGLCHYPQGCARQAAGCGRCPLLPSPHWPWPDPSHRGYRRKLHALAKAPITYVGISPWVQRQLQASPITAGRSVEMIWNCIDAQAFQPLEPQAARRALGLDPHGGPYLLAEWRSPRSEPWKGFQHLLQILPGLRAMGCSLLLFGSLPPELKALASAEGIRNFGRISDDARLRLLYSAADLFVCPTLEEAFGKTMAEAMSCGTPVVAFPGSAPADLVEPGLTGLLAGEMDTSPALLEAIAAALSQTAQLSAHCAARARQRFSQTVAASAYRDLYGRLCPGSVRCVQQA
jgi:glycosyltransferase involved in cell wall biosynthesis